MTPVPMDEAVARYVAWWQGLPGTLDQIDTAFTPDGRFADPFGDIRGSAAIRRHLQKAYGKLYDVQIDVSDRAISGRVVYLRWTFALRMRRSKALRTIIGMSEVHIGDDGRATAHVDHWDATSQVYEHIPVIATLLRAVRARINH